MKKLLLLIMLFSLTAVLFAQSNARVRSEDTNLPEIDNLSGLKPDAEDLAPDYGVTDMTNNETQTGTNGANDDSYTGSTEETNIKFEREVTLANTAVFPNPATDNITVTTEVDFGTIRILNLLGQELYSFTIQGYTSNINITDLNEGIYFVSIESGDQKIVKKLKVLY